MNQKIDAHKSLTKALIIQEGTERRKLEEDLMKFIGESLDVLSKNLRSSFETSNMQLKFECDKKLKAVEDQVNEFKQYVLSQLVDVQKSGPDKKMELDIEFYLRDCYQQLVESQIQDVCAQVSLELTDIKKSLEIQKIAQIQTEQDLQKAQNDLRERQTFIKDQLGENIEQIEVDMYQLDQKQSDHLEELRTQIEAQRFLDGLNQMGLQEQSQLMHQEHSDAINAIAEKFNSAQDTHREFLSLFEQCQLVAEEKVWRVFQSQEELRQNLEKVYAQQESGNAKAQTLDSQQPLLQEQISENTKQIKSIEQENQQIK